MAVPAAPAAVASATAAPASAGAAGEAPIAVIGGGTASAGISAIRVAEYPVPTPALLGHMPPKYSTSFSMICGVSIPSAGILAAHNASQWTRFPSHRAAGIIVEVAVR